MKIAATALFAALLFWFVPLAQSSQDHDSETWRAMVEGMRKDIANLDGELTRLDQSLGAQAKELDAGVAKADDRLNQLLLMRGVAGTNPWAYRTILFQMSNLAEYITLKKNPLLEAKAMVDKGKLDYSAMRTVRRSGTNVPPSEMTTAFLMGPESDYARLKDKTKAVKDRIDSILARADAELEAVKDAANQTRQVFIHRMGDFYFSPGPDLTSGSGRSEFSLAFNQWTNNFPRFWYPLIVWVQWGEFIVYSVLWTLALYLLCHLARRKMAKRLGLAEAPPLFSRPALWLSLGLGMAAAMGLTYFTINQATYMLAFALATLGAMQGAGKILSMSLEPEDAPKKKGVLFFLWLAFVAGSGLMALNMPVPCLAPFWMAVSLAGALAMYRMRARGPVKRSELMAVATFWIFAASAAVSLFGLAAQAMALVQAWFMIMLTGRLVLALRLLCVRAAAQRTATEPPPAGAEASAEAAAAPDESAAAPEQGEAPPPEPKTEHPLSRCPQEPQSGSRQGMTLAYPLLALMLAFVTLGSFFLYLGGFDFARYVFRFRLALGQVAITPRGVAYIIACFFLVKIALYWTALVLDRLAAWNRIDKPLSHSLGAVASYALWVGWVLASLALVNAPLSALTWIASGLSVGIGFGLKDIVNNFVSGLIIMFGGTIKRGDVILHNKLYGTVTDVSVRNTTILTRENSVVVIPNSSILKGDVVNLTGKDKRLRLKLPITVAPGAKLKKVKKILLKAAGKHPHVLKDPKPEVFFDAMGQFGPEVSLYFWVDDFSLKFETESDLVFDLDDRFREERIMVAFRTAKVKYKLKKSPEEVLLEHQEKRNTFYKLLRERQRKVARARPLGTKPRKA